MESFFVFELFLILFNKNTVFLVHGVTVHGWTIKSFDLFFPYFKNKGEKSGGAVYWLLRA
jgi:sRNA-binding regulator protein Hfq